MDTEPSKQPGKIRRMFGSIAGRYDLLNRVLSLSIDRLWRRRMAGYVESEPVLDVACGTGDVIGALRRQGWESIVGLDFSFPMLSRGCENFEESPPFVQGTAADLPMAGSTVGTVTCAFGVRNFHDRPICFREFRRVLNEQGRLIILEFFPPDDRWYLKPYHFYLRQILPRIGRLISGSDEAYDYLRNSVEQFASRDEVNEELRQSGFNRVQFIDLTMGIATLIVADV